MSVLPRVSPTTRELVSREFDDLGPAACVPAIVKDIQRNNPELLHMARQWVNDLDDPDGVMAAFSMFYRLLGAELPAIPGSAGLSPLPRVSDDARSMIVERIDAEGGDTFSLSAIDDMDQSNPELLQMAHYFASGRADYAQIMRGFALLYATLKVQTDIDRLGAH